MRWVTAGALLVALAATPVPVASAANGARAVVAFLPAGGDETRPLLDELAGRGMAIGMTSPTVGGFKPRQMALDMSQGTRIPTRLYSEDPPRLELERGQTFWRLSGWQRALRRAADAPGDIRPGLLASSVERGGGAVAYLAVSARVGAGRIVAADEHGAVRAQLLPASRLVAAAARVRPWADLTVVDLDAGRAGLVQLDGLLRQRRSQDLVYAVRAPVGDDLDLLPTGVAGPDLDGRLRSNTTRRDGLVAATDVAPTVLEGLGIEVPDEMQGQPIEGRGDADPAAVRAMTERLDVITDRRGIALLWLVGAWVLLLLVRRADALRIALLAVLWMPGVALLTAALEPGRLVEAATIGVGSLVLAAVTDRAVRWPLAPALPAGVVFLAHAIDLARGSPLIGASLVGPNPAGGARFFGIGNELEVLLSLSVILGTGAALAARRLEPAARAAAFATLLVLAALVMGAGRLGADVGAVITLGAGGAAAVVAALTRTPSRRVIALAVAAPVAALVLLVLVDVVSGGGAHFSRSVLGAGESGDLLDVVERRFEGSASSLGRPGWVAAVVVAIAVLVWLAAQRRRFLDAVPEAWRAGLIGSWFAVVIGALANDSGPQIVTVGALVLLAAAGYVVSTPPGGRLRS